ncbi:hypothetical protein [Hydrogenophaga sp.]|uniref:hypothetical protein n=1 Tax=Hydrogenophaga sp. TaxID=1904254 RepID=UPI002731815C|nr:hypothetical protein [Hydrogenophaga sp.]MDP1686891.1 hypothetical protein [Hydrogenophaga sp.]
MTAPPARNDVGGAGNPSRATAKTAFTALYDYVVERLGGTAATATSGEQDTACTAIGAVRKTGDAMTGNLNVPSINGGQLAGFRNVLINGGMQINQEGLTSVADDTYCLDQWYVLTETGNVTVAQQTDQENGTPFNIRLTQPDVTAKQIGLAQIIEASSSKPLRAKTATLAARIRCSASTQINYAVLEWTGTADAVTSDVISSWSGSPTYIGSITERAKGSITPAAATWTDAPGLNAAINASTNNLIVLIWSNTDLAQNVTLDIGRAQLEPGTVATPFEHRPVAVEQALSQRFYQMADWLVSTYASVGSQDYYGVVNFPVRMRALPTAVKSGGVFTNSTDPGAASISASRYSAFARSVAAGPLYASYTVVASARL